MVKWYVSLMLALFAAVQTASAEVSAELNQYIVPYGESVQLTITVVGDAGGEPDITPLKQDFDILGQSQSSNYSFINGSMKSSKTWTYGLMPKREGMVQVPGIQVGQAKTHALMLKVISAQSQPKSARKIWLESSLSDHDIWVQAQTVLTIKLIRAVNLSQADLSEPDIPDAIVQRMGDDHNYEAVVDGRRVIINERKYAVFPQKAGDITIPAVQMDGVISNGRSMFSQGRSIRLRSEPLTLHVQPKPNTWKGGLWLPAKSLALQEQWLDDPVPTYRVGEPFTRVIELQAEGLTAAQLPSLLQDKSVQGFKLYPDKPELDMQVKDGNILGIRREKVAMMPTQAGKLWLPEIRVAWWNTQTQSIQHVIIAGREIEVLPAVGQQGKGVAAQPPAATPAQNNVPETSVEEVPQQVQAQPSSFWQWVAWGLAGLWLVTLGLWWASTRKRAASKQQVSEPDVSIKLSSVEKALKQACQGDDAKQAMKLLPAWGAAYFKDENIQYLAKLKGQSQALDAAIADLERHLYAASASSVWSGQQLWDAIASLLHGEAKNNKQKHSLPDLYPS
ncbi:BatD family protein [Ghiorsea bivora]|uniref:BatD family protein n=1 Tax=Ghiorsea bivora TaxID=1485545 RepID=UPI00068C4CCA|nr:BatD family protein [Ghiorsea bivora]